jgi:LysM repeat protein
VSKF